MLRRLLQGRGIAQLSAVIAAANRAVAAVKSTGKLKQWIKIVGTMNTMWSVKVARTPIALENTQIPLQFSSVFLRDCSPS
jgi:hypothetical protein